MILKKENYVDAILNYKRKTHQLQQKTSFRKAAFCLIQKNKRIRKLGRMKSKGGEKVNHKLYYNSHLKSNLGICMTNLT